MNRTIKGVRNVYTRKVDDAELNKRNLFSDVHSERQEETFYPDYYYSGKSS